MAYELNIPTKLAPQGITFKNSNNIGLHLEDPKAIIEKILKDAKKIDNPRNRMEPIQFLAGYINGIATLEKSEENNKLRSDLIKALADFNKELESISFGKDVKHKNAFECLEYNLSPESFPEARKLLEESKTLANSKSSLTKSTPDEDKSLGEKILDVVTVFAKKVISNPLQLLNPTNWIGAALSIAGAIGDALVDAISGKNKSNGKDGILSIDAQKPSSPEPEQQKISGQKMNVSIQNVSPEQLTAIIDTLKEHSSSSLSRTDAKAPINPEIQESQKFNSR
jgi:hypothetical protein